jgi:hypothetical protein
MTLLILSLGYGVGAGALAATAVQIKRSVVYGWRARCVRRERDRPQRLRDREQLNWRRGW